MKLPLLFKAASLLPFLAIASLAQASEHPRPAESSLEFIENKGQWDAHVRYAAPLPGGRLFAEADGLTFSLLANGGPAQLRHDGPSTAAEGPVRGHALTLHFEGAAPATLTAATPTAEHRNYLLGNDARRWVRDVRGFRELHYAGLWPGVSARVYESADQHLEYDFELAPRANPAAIALRHDGADGLALDPAGNLLVRTSVGTMTERAPQAWQTDAAGRRKSVACRYVLAGKLVRFALGTYDPSRPLTIDPVVVFASYTGSTANNWGFTATYDDDGNMYSGGIAFSEGYPTSPGAFQTTFAALIDIAIIKYNTSATGPAARVWATYLGGNGTDFPHSLVVNHQGELLVLGSSGSSDYPTSAAALQQRFAGGTPSSPFGSGPPFNSPTGSDLVITRLNANGSGLVASTYLGGSKNDGLLPLDIFLSPSGSTLQLAHNYGDAFRGDIQVDAADNVYIASHTMSDDFPLGTGFGRTYRGGSSDGVACKLTPTLSSLTWGGFLGGSGADAAYSIQIEPTSGDVYVAGGTISPDFPVTSGAYRTTRPGNVDGFAARIAANGASVLRATYVGTNAYDQAYFLQLGTDGGVYLLGQTLGAFTLTPGLFSTTNGTLFIQKLDASLGQSLLSTAFGSTDPANAGKVSVDPTAFLVDRCDRVYVCGWGGSSNRSGPDTYLANNGSTTRLPTTADAAQLTTDGSDFYLAQFAAGLTGMTYGTYYGSSSGAGEHVDGGTSRFDPRGIVYQAVCSCFARTGFPIPAGAHTYSTTNNSGTGQSSLCNNASFVFNFQPGTANAGADQEVCATAGPQPLVGTPAGGIWAGPGVSGSLATGFVFTPSVALVGLQTLTYTYISTGLCTTTDARRVAVGQPPAAVVISPLLQAAYCRPGPGLPPLPLVPLSATPAGGTFSGPGVSGSVATGFVFTPNQSTGTVQIVYTLNADGCVVQGTRDVTIGNGVSAGADQTLCAEAGAQALVGSPAGGTWSGPGVSGSVAAGFVFTPSAALVGPQTLTYTATSTGTCSNTATRLVTVTALPVLNFAPLPQPAYCLPVAGAPALPAVPLVATPAGGTFSGPGVSGSSATGYFFSPTLSAGTYQLVYTLSSNGCVLQASQPVTLTSPFTATVAADTVLCPGSTRPFALRGSPAGGTFTGPSVSGSAATGFVFTPSANLSGSVSLTYAVTRGGCTATATRRISVAVPPVLLASWQPVACPETRLAPLTLRFAVASSSGSTAPSVVWDFGDGSKSSEVSPTHTYATPGLYQPRVLVRYNQDRCDITATAPPVEVKARNIPNIITPNGDSQNQTFKIGPDCVPRLQVFSRWGQSVFESATYHDEWDAQGQPAGVYYYLLTYPDGHRLKGWVEVVR
ncbi:hypothetical protein AUC43_05375 [Hymenobacter sedentarius]|uniref:PKD domain-containing protein n=1 Tax=Hymenobacter sedentarius TaxID=1411621 RepID=A0A0U4AM50_9BACT|nr:gliding motility-associated C-terminal domain-containing protein [Hymenobacter sedentarius]ALW84565.1 hypothetical protein AUC43_05375 [Hymenobacter sedentarius]